METSQPGHCGGIAFFAGHFGIGADLCNGLLELAPEGGGDYADLFFEYTRQRTISFEDQTVRGTSSGIVQGLGARVVCGDAVGYAYTEQFDLDSMRQAVRTAARIAERSTAAFVRPQAVTRSGRADRYQVESYSLDEPAALALAMLHGADEAARAVAPSIHNVEAHLIGRSKKSPSRQASAVLLATVSH